MYNFSITLYIYSLRKLDYCNSIFLNIDITQKPPPSYSECSRPCCH